MDSGDNDHAFRVGALDEYGLGRAGASRRARRAAEATRRSSPMSERLHWSFSVGSVPETSAELGQMVREELDQLADQLADLPPKAVRLHIDAEGGRPDASRKVTLRLAIPDHLLRVEACGHDLAAAVRKAFARLFRRLRRVKAKLRGEPLWKQKWRRYQSHAGRRSAQFDEGSPREESRTPADLERLWDDASAELSAYARRVLRSAQEPDGGRLQVEKRAAAALAESWTGLMQISGDLPEGISTRAEFYRALRHRLTAFSGATPAREQTVPSPARSRVGLPAAIDRSALHRDVFQLYFREGFEDSEIAWILGQPPAEVRRAIADLNQNLRSILVCGGDNAVLRPDDALDADLRVPSSGAAPRGWTEGATP